MRVSRALVPLVFVGWRIAQAEPGTPVAVVLERQGAVTATHGGTTPRPLRVLDAVEETSRVELGRDSHVVLFFIDSGREFAVRGDAVVQVESGGLKSLSGSPPTARDPVPGGEIRLRRDRLALGGIVLRNFPKAPRESTRQCPEPTVPREEIARRQPERDAPLAARVLYALWLDDVCAPDQARSRWRELAREMPGEPAIQQRAR